MISRRSFIGLTGAGLAAPAALAAGCGRADEVSTVVSGTTEQDIDLLGEALELERGAVVAYERGAELLSGEARELAELFGEQEREHADVLAAGIERLGGTPDPELDAAEYADELKLGDVRTEEDVLDLAVELANTAIATYDDAVGRLSEPDLRRTLYEIVANEAEHLTVLLGLRGEPQVPDAFVTGSRP